MRAALMVVVCLTGCTATVATVNLVAADQALGRATEHGAAEGAPYEYTLSVRYLEKAREESGYADYKAASTLARQAADYADQAIIAMEKRATVTVDRAENNLTDERQESFEILDEPEVAE